MDDVIRRIRPNMIKTIYFYTQRILTFKISLIRIVDTTKHDDGKLDLTIIFMYI